MLDPAVGRLTGADSGPGRLPEPDQVAAVARAVLAAGPAAAGAGDLAGRHVVVSAGGTREPLDPVRYLGNRSSGRQGWALAHVALARGARVTVVAANVALADPAGAHVLRVETAGQLRAAVLAAAGAGAGAGSAAADAVVMAAAVADFRPAAYAEHKIKKPLDDETAPVVELARNPDVLAEVAATAPRPAVVVGFAAETGDDGASVLDHGRAKLARKGGRPARRQRRRRRARLRGGRQRRDGAGRGRLAHRRPPRPQGGARQRRLGPRRRPPARARLTHRTRR